MTDVLNDTKSAPLSQEKLAFLPAALEIQAAPPAKWSRSLLWTLMVFILSAVIWASWAEIDIVATAQGKIVPNGQVKIIQPLEAGVVEAIYVKEGQMVSKGDKLIALDGTANSANIERFQSEWLEYSSDLARQNTFLKMLKNDNAQQSLSLNVNDNALLMSIWNEYNAKLESIDSDIVKQDAEKKALDIDVARLVKTLPLVIEREQSYSKLLKTSAVSRNQYLELKQLRIDQEESLNMQKARIEQLNASIVSSHHNRRAYQSEVRRTTLQEVNRLTLLSNSAQQELVKAQKLSSLQILTAPVDGVVEQLAIATIGGVVSPAQELLRIVPKEQELMIEAGLLNKDIGFVYAGQTAEVKIDSFPFTKYGVIDSQVIDVSSDAVENEQLGLLFPLKATLIQRSINADGRMVKLIPGMSVTIEIKTGKRRLMEFLLAPLMKGVSEGGRER
ncbi:HlyD family type I secretion periplasmic adaptor subunit (plasmid) [Psychrobium sp. nBUS_13]|uniref:HlyD family type I secretion periplasmic adaptor subunit n=1 Tax=Psychrobium sp. nBUS_13 TaxID=3395319 RepID=UPI003EB88CB1